jgi:microcystin-dependent protein
MTRPSITLTFPRPRTISLSVLLLAGTIAYAAAPELFESGEPLSSAKLNDNFAALKESSVPSGAIMAFGGTTVPAGWLLCDGMPLDGSRSEYASLYEAIGDAYGGSAPHTFNVPDLRGRFLRGVDTGNTGNDPDRMSRVASVPGGNAGNAVGSLQSDALASHTHMYQGAGASYGMTLANSAFSAMAAPASTMSAASGGAETRPRNIAVNYIIKL